MLCIVTVSYIVVISLSDFVSDPVPVETIQKIKKKQVAFTADGYSFGELFLCV